MAQVLSVRINGLPVGDLVLDDSGKMRFQYSPGAGRPASLGLPLRDQPFDHDACEAYFGGLLPESMAARKAIARQFGANARNSFSLLKAIGHDCAGAVSLHAPDEPVEPRESWPLDVRELEERELAGLIRDLPRKPLFLGVDGLRLSLSGAQDKAAICLVDGRPALPLRGCPTTHILKPADRDRPDLVLNEYLCLRLAAGVGLDVPETELRMAQDVPYLLEERYDRAFTPDGRIRRIHQEDFCQALGVPAALKYEADGGPGIAACFALTLRFTTPAPARLKLMKLLLFNLLIGNCDAHAKNYSLLHLEGGRTLLAPVYDVVSTRFYPDLTNKMAMKVAGYYQTSKLEPRHLTRLSEEVGLAPAFVRTALRDLGARLLRAIDLEETRAGPQGARILDFIQNRSSRVLERLLGRP